MDQEQRRISLEDTLRLFLVNALSEENSDPALQVVRGELKREIIEAVRSGFQGDSITTAMSDGVRATFKSPEISDAMVKSVGPAIDAATQQAFGPLLRELSNYTVSSDLEKALYELANLIRDIPNQVASASDLAALRSQVEHLSAKTDETQRIVRTSTGQLFAGLRANSAQSGNPEADIDRARAIAALMEAEAVGDDEFSQGDKSPSADEAAAKKPTKDTKSKRSWFGDVFSPAGRKGLVTGVGIMLLAILSAYGLGTLLAGSADSQQPSISSLRPDPRPTQNDLAPSPTNDRIDAAVAEAEEELAPVSGLTQADIDRINLGLTRANKYASENVLVKIMCQSDRDCTYSDVWPLEGNDAPLPDNSISGLAQLAAIQLNESYQCPQMPDFYRADGIFGNDSVTVAKSVYTCVTQYPQQSVSAACQRENVAEAIRCQLSGHFNSVPNQYKSDAEALKLWLIWGLGADEI